ncbi:CdaR family protein [Loigolactobacillus jiayinensis]|uniref:YbbR-like domain-containing protein n=1 Tax=Loigolactobacillus jiayinensis TaxID=2486016 RepID=A0ABW1RBJ6_9LACO|nr:CdaR family protein [Loigolactobacillus jiayinensis]
MNGFNKFLNSPLVYRILALIFAIMLFGYVNVDRINSTRQATSSSTTMLANKSRTLNVPLQINANTDKYFITGYPEKVKVNIEGPSALVTATANTQNFKIMANLEKLGVGKHTVRLTEEGLNKELGYRIVPSRIKVNIQTRATKRFPIQVKFNKANLAQGYTSGDPELSQATTVVTGSKAEINAIESVVANVNTENNITADVTQQTALQALDQKGNTVNALLDPTTVKVTIPVMRPTKKVPISLKQTGEGDDDKTYSLSTDVNNVTLTGSQASLDKISTLNLNVSIADVTKTTTKTITVPTSNGVQANPSTVSVKITVSDAEAESTASSSSATSSTATSTEKDSSDSSSSASASGSSSSASNSENSTSSSSSE